MRDPKNFHGRGKVAILRTRPETVLDDYARLMRLCEYEQDLPQARDTILKINLSWQLWFPSSSTTPWQLDGVIRTLLRDGYARERLAAAYNDPGVADPDQGALNNRHRLVLDHYAIPALHALKPAVEWVEYQPTSSLAILDKFYPDGIFVPKAFIGKNIVHLPTMKTDAVTMLNGAVKDVFGGMLDERRRLTRPDIHDTLVDLLQISQDIHSGLFFVMDGTFAGEGPGPRALRPYVKNTILASSDPVALDAVAASIMGIDPLRVRFIRHAHERGLGVGDPREIKILGDAETAQENWHFEHDQDSFASWGQKQLDHGVLKPLNELMLAPSLAPLSGAAAKIYNDLYWYPYVGARRAEMMLNTGWGQKFLQYSEELPVNPGASDKTRLAAIALLSTAAVVAFGIGALYSSRRRGQF